MKNIHYKQALLDENVGFKVQLENEKSDKEGMQQLR
jgi:hypothetical protein